MKHATKTTTTTTNANRFGNGYDEGFEAYYNDTRYAGEVYRPEFNPYKYNNSSSHIRFWCGWKNAQWADKER